MANYVYITISRIMLNLFIMYFRDELLFWQETAGAIRTRSLTPAQKWPFCDKQGMLSLKV